MTSPGSRPRPAYARHNATALVEASSGPKPRHRLNLKGNRQLNHALHLAAVTQISHDTAGRDQYQRKLAETQSKKEAMRARSRDSTRLASPPSAGSTGTAWDREVRHFHDG